MPFELPLQSPRLGLAAPSSPPARSRSMSSASMSSFGGLLSPAATVTPEPAFIAPSAASQIVTNNHDSKADIWFDQHGIEPSGETALVSPPAIKLVNKFLDQLLFNFLAVAQSTSLGRLRPAVTETLRSKLAKAAISGADQELQEYLGGSEDYISPIHDGKDSRGQWDTELVWKRTRLRCMVYSSLGDMEEEDEDFYTQQDHLAGPGSADKYSNIHGAVSPAVAIFLTSILEYVGEQALVAAGQAAYHRTQGKHSDDEDVSPGLYIADRVVVEEPDVERIALDRTLGRLWRAWKKRAHAPLSNPSGGSTFAREVSDSSSIPKPVLAHGHDVNGGSDRRPTSEAEALVDCDYAAKIPLPMSDDDVREIEIPGVASQIDDDVASGLAPLAQERSVRPKSMVIFTGQSPPTPNSSHPSSPNAQFTPKRKRALSLPCGSSNSICSSSKRSKNYDGEDPHAISAEKFESRRSESNLAATVTPPDSANGDFEEDKGTTELSNHHDLSAELVPASSGSVAALNGVAVEHETNHNVEPDSPTDVDDFVGEVKIMTSARISFSGGRLSPEELSRHSSIRSPSVHSAHSLRIIEVARSPTVSGSSSSSLGDVPSPRIITISRPNSIISPIYPASPRGTSPAGRGSGNSPLMRGSSLSSMLSVSGDETISEVDELDCGDVSPGTIVPSNPAVVAQGVDAHTSSISQSYPQGIVVPKQQERPFILGAPPVPRNMRESLSPPKVRLPVARSVSSSPSRSPRNSSLALAPLQEMREAAPETSHDFPIPPRNGARVPPVYSSPAVGRSPTSQQPNFPTEEASTSTSRPSTSATYKPSPSAPSRDEHTRKLGAAGLDTGTVSQRPTHTSGSGSSSSTQKMRSSMDSRQSFEQLIKSDQTIQYTLTPENMRNIEGPVPELWRPVSVRSKSTSVSRATGLNSNPYNQAGPTKASSVFSPNFSRPGTAATTGSRLRSSGPQARDARVDRDSLGDFADFIRSTGPSGAYSNGKPPRTAASDKSRRTNGSVRTASISALRAGPVAALPRRSQSSAGRAKLQARDATVGRASITELIDFVRAGPEDQQDHRIPRTIAPFRSTMDSDQMSAAGGKAIDAILPDSRSSQVSASLSINSSMTSTTPLINSPPRTNKSHLAHNQRQVDEEDMMPQRKTRRVRDPYAIDFSDEEDDLIEENTRPPPIKEESLADFLRSVPPPPETAPVTVFESAPKPRKKPSFSSRWGRTSSNPPPMSPPARSQTAPQNPVALKQPVSTLHSASKTGVNASPPGTGRSPPSLNRQQSYQTREASAQYPTRTNDLAEFLRNSSPPPSIETKPFIPRQEEGNAFSRLFGRRRKLAS